MKKLFIGGISEDTTEADLEEHFRQHGIIEEVKLPTDKTSKRRGFAFITFTDHDVVNKLVGKLQTSGLVKFTTRQVMLQFSLTPAATHFQSSCSDDDKQKILFCASTAFQSLPV